MLSRQPLKHRAGFTILFAMLSMSALVGFTALAVDFGHIQAAKFELRAACDAAARAGAQSLGSTTLTSAAMTTAATANAITIASQNNVDGQPLLLTSSMIKVGNYNTAASPSFLVGRLPLNAVQVSGYRDQSHSNPISMSLATMVGITTVDISTTSTALKSVPSTYGIAGLNSATFSSLGVLARINGNLVSNGDINVGMPLGLLVGVTQDVRTFSGSVNTGALVGVGGSIGNLTNQLVYPSVTAPTRYDNSAIATYLDSSQNFTAAGIADVAAGTYVVHDLNFLAGVVINLQGPVTFYVTGSFNMAATVNLLNLLNTTSNNLNVLVTSGGSVNFVGSLILPVYMNIYAPDSAITIAITVNSYTGCLIGKTLHIAIPIASQFTEGPPPANLTQTSLVQ